MAGTRYSRLIVSPSPAVETGWRSRPDLLLHKSIITIVPR